MFTHVDVCVPSTALQAQLVTLGKALTAREYQGSTPGEHGAPLGIGVLGRVAARGAPLLAAPVHLGWQRLGMVWAGQCILWSPCFTQHRSYTHLQIILLTL